MKQKNKIIKQGTRDIKYNIIIIMYIIILSSLFDLLTYSLELKKNSTTASIHKQFNTNYSVKPHQYSDSVPCHLELSTIEVRLPSTCWLMIRCKSIWLDHIPFSSFFILLVAECKSFIGVLLIYFFRRFCQVAPHILNPCINLWTKFTKHYSYGLPKWHGWSLWYIYAYLWDLREYSTTFLFCWWPFESAKQNWL